ncbi:S-adenosyl-L-methionine-dependent methyltransferase [Mycena sanguinolenta]|uniref:S-adenosyl-L-methionine-dependent methyltransferase n=1 Tax=Mycena sanguinolenta TaxID=230812 RepID=A0A8H7CHV7_9AGAR|nr:S-adenosyl-L-methionine-dependent methyltransferase [Mycena sanguinolenta]
MHNDRFTTYYQSQKILPDGEWDVFMETAQSLNATLRDTHVPTLSNVEFEGQSIPPPVQIPWYPDGLAWQFNVPKKVLRKQPEFKGFHSFLVFETEVGNISRQEAVSMLPPLFMDVEPHHKVMDMCAAPGSKVVHHFPRLRILTRRRPLNSSKPSTRKTPSPPPRFPPAFSSQTTATTSARTSSSTSPRVSPAPALMVTNLDASIYPQLKLPSATNANKMETLLFDRILCDVPCSGDGTMRKNLGIWKTWQPMDGNGLHGLQLRILQRAMKMLAPRGRIVYSTCSLNPVENEAVIACALRNNPDFRLIDVSEKLPALHRRPGLTSWRPTDKSLCTTYDTYETFMATCAEGDAVKAKMTRGHWPPEDVEKLELPKCLRIYPHLQDTGGFFVAVLERSSTGMGTAAVEEAGEAAPRKREAEVDESVEIPESKKPRLDVDGVVKAEDDAEPPAETTSVAAEAATKNPAPPKAGKQKKGEGGGSFKENPYTYLAPNDPAILSSRAYISPPAFPSSNVLVRTPLPEGDAEPAPVRNMYITNALVKQLVTHNDYNRIRLTCAGTKVFTKQEAGRGADAQFRVLGEALPLIVPYTDPEAIVVGDFTTLRILVEKAYPLCAAFPDGGFKDAMTARGTGSHIARFPRELDSILSHDLILPLWKSTSSITLMIDKKAKSALSMRVFGKDITSPVKEKEPRGAEDAEGEGGEEEDAGPVVVSLEDVEEGLDAADAGGWSGRRCDGRRECIKLVWSRKNGRE